MSFLRPDGRRGDQLRPVRFTPGYVRTCPGAVLAEMGDTRVICTVSVEDRVPPFLVGAGKGWLTAEYGMLPGSSPSRIARESTTGRPNSRTREIQRLIGRSLRAAVDLVRLGERTLCVDCDVIQADGGTRTASITGAWVALVLATGALERAGRLDASPIIAQVAAVSVGLVEGEMLLDLCYTEDARADTDLNAVMTGDGGIVELQATAERKPFSRAQAEALVELSGEGIRQLAEHQRRALAAAGETAGPWTQDVAKQ